MEDQIRIQATPSQGDPMKCSFLVDRPVFPEKSFYFADRDRAAGSPLVERLMEIPGVETVLVSHDTITVTKNVPDDWKSLAREIGTAIREALQSGEPPISESVLEDMLPPEKIRHVVQQVIDTQINPMVEMHGGRIRLLDVKDNVVFIEMGGGCQGCGMADVTLKSGIERVIREFIPEVGDILDVTDHASGRNPYYSPSASR